MNDPYELRNVCGPPGMERLTATLRAALARLRREVKHAAECLTRARSDRQVDPAARQRAAASALIGLDDRDGRVRVRGGARRRCSSAVALDDATGAILRDRNRQYRHHAFLAFPKQFATSAAPDLELHVILDNYATR